MTTLSQIKKAAVGQTVHYFNPPFCSSMLLDYLREKCPARVYSIESVPAGFSFAYNVTRTA